MLSGGVATIAPVPLPLPSTLSPSKVKAFRTCGLAFRFSDVERLPTEPSVPAVKGTLVHRALQLLFDLPAPRRTAEAAHRLVDTARAQMADDPEWTGLDLDPEAEADLVADAHTLVDGYLRLEDPRTVTPVGLEVQMEVDLGRVRARGIIDRLEIIDGELVVTDYKTGRAPRRNREREHLQGVAFYALLCDRLLGRTPARVQLLHLRESERIVTTPTAQAMRALERRLEAAWDAIVRACERDDFRPRPGPLCDWCSFRAFCPAFGGDPTEAAVALGVAR